MMCKSSVQPLPLAARTTYYFAPVHVTEGREWVSPDSGSSTREEAERKAVEFARACPAWAQENPLVRISRFRLVEDNQ
jgi:hypothetical protein